MNVEKTDVLEGFVPTDPNVVNWRGGRFARCGSRDLLEAFVESGEECLSKSMPPGELDRALYNLRHYRKRHQSEFGNVGISGRGGRLILYRLDKV